MKAKAKTAKRSPLGSRYFLVQPCTTGALPHGVSVNALETVTAFIRAKVRLGLAQVIDTERRLVMTVNGAWAKLDSAEARKEDPWVFSEFTKANPPELKVNTSPLPVPAPAPSAEAVAVPAQVAPSVAEAAKPAPVPTLQGATAVPPPSDTEAPHPASQDVPPTEQEAGIL